MIRAIAMFVLLCCTVPVRAETVLDYCRKRMHPGKPSENNRQIPGCPEKRQTVTDAPCPAGEIHRKKEGNSAGTGHLAGTIGC